MTMRTVHFTPKEAEAINHRLEAADCIAEVWGPDNDNVWPGLDYAAVAQRTEELIASTFFDRPDKSMDLVFNPENEDQLRLIVEALEGNTMGGIVHDMLQFCSDEPVYKVGTGWKRAMRSIENKLEAAGITASFNL